jgi:hypothetical protein
MLKKETVLDLRKYINATLKNLDYIQHTYLPARYARLCKYLNRGYNITITSEFWWWVKSAVRQVFSEFDGTARAQTNCDAVIVM